jgi:hypothetical protein
MPCHVQRASLQLNRISVGAGCGDIEYIGPDRASCVQTFGAEVFSVLSTVLADFKEGKDSGIRQGNCQLGEEIQWHTSTDRKFRVPFILVKRIMTNLKRLCRFFRRVSSAPDPAGYSLRGSK